jgi:hypothetical protein
MRTRARAMTMRREGRSGREGRSFMRGQDPIVRGLIAFVAIILVACGSGTSGGSSSGSAAPTVATASTGQGGSTSAEPSGSGGATGTLDAEAVAKVLVPPDSKEVTKTTTPDVWFAVYESTASLDALKSFYEGAIPKAGLKIISTTTANGGIAWAVATDESAAFGGSVSIYPSGSGSALAVSVTVGKTS